MDREETWKLLCEYTQSENLRRHGLAVEACMRAYARKFGEDEEKWGVVGLIHDFDYELYPNAPDHPLKGSAILSNLGIRKTFAAPSLPMPTIAVCLATRSWQNHFSRAMSWRALSRPVLWSGPTEFKASNPGLSAGG